MSDEKYYYVNILEKKLTSRKLKNPSYSIGAFARDLRMSTSTLRMALSKKRKIPAKNINYIVKQLSLSKEDEYLFRDSLSSKVSRLDRISTSKEYYNRYILDDSYHKVIVEWEYYALITLIETTSFISNKSYITKKLDISMERLDEVLKNLFELNLVASDEDGEYYLTKGPLRTSEDIKSQSLKMHHQENLILGKHKLNNVDVELRDFSSLNVATNLNKLSEAKEIIREFRKKMASLLKEGDTTDVFQLCIQLYPLSDCDNETKG